jgi:hypothetical protein
MGNYRNNGPSLSGMRTFRVFYRTKREPIIWLNGTKSGLRREDRTIISPRLPKPRATLKTKKQAKQIRDARINNLMRGVRSEIARKKKREEGAALRANRAVMAEVRARYRENRARDREWLLIRKISEQARRAEEREKRRIERSRMKAENARRKAEKARLKAVKEQRERIRVRKALAKQASLDRVKARELRLTRLLKEIRRKRRG